MGAFGTRVSAATALIYPSKNMIISDRFDGTLSQWITSGNVAIVTVDTSTKMKLTNSSGTVSSKAAFTAALSKYLVEFDLLYSAANGVTAQLLDGSGAVIASVACGLTANTLSFSTDTVGATNVTFAEATYNQIVFCVDPDALQISAYWIDKSYSISSYNPLKLIATKAYSGAVVAALNFLTDAGKTGYVYVDEVRVYIPDFAVIGDSISDGKNTSTNGWSGDPSTTFRITGTPDQTASPAYKLGLLLGSTTWVGSRGFGGAQSSEIAADVQSLIINQGFKRLYIHVGFNDINRNLGAAVLEANITSTVNTLLAAGWSSTAILICNIYGSATLSGSKATDRTNYNTWIASYCSANGLRLVDNNINISTTPTTNSLKAAYDCGDGIHMNKTGYGVLANNVYSALLMRGLT